MDSSSSFRVDLSIFRGPLDLLLFLVRKHELDIHDLPIALVVEQYLQHLDVLREIDINAVGDFLEMASTLVEIKSRLVLPKVEEVEETLEEPREDLVQQLLQYKRYRDAATILEEQSRTWQQRYLRQANDLPVRKVDPAEQPIHEVELWDLVSALGRILRDSHTVQPTNIVYDDTPIHVYMERIHEKLTTDGRVSFTQMFEPGMHKSAMIGVFLAILELVRHHRVQTDQSDPHGEIWVLPGQAFEETADFSDVDNYEYQPEDPQSDAEE